jgi:crotonobetainyl-CoA:carnitine CoA-transferase CaiB-like acyl-CoA transferase
MITNPTHQRRVDFGADLLGLLARQRTGRGQIIDAAMVDGASYLMTPQLAELGRNEWAGRGASLLSGVAPFYSGPSMLGWPMVFGWLD